MIVYWARKNKDLKVVGMRLLSHAGKWNDMPPEIDKLVLRLKTRSWQIPARFMSGNLDCKSAAPQ